MKIKSATTLCFVAGLHLVCAAPVLAHDAGSTAAPAIGVSTVTPRTVIAVYANSKILVLPSIHIPANVTRPYDKFKVACPQATCTLLIDVMQQVSNAAQSDAGWAVVVNVGDSALPAPFLGTIPTPGIARVGNWQGKVTVTKGYHYVTFSTTGTTSYSLSHWDNRVTVTTP